MRISTCGYYFRESFRSLRRNNWLAIASIGTMAVALLILGASVLLVLNMDYLSTNVESEVEISVFLTPENSKEMLQEIEQQLNNIEGVKEVNFIDKEKGLEILKKDFGDREVILSSLARNPLPDKYEVKATKPEFVHSIANKAQQLPGVEKVRYAQEVVDKLFSITKMLRIAGIVIMGLLALAAIFLIATTIRLTVFARRKEIQIMKMIGATDWFIRWPFIIEGMILGLVGAFLAVGILYWSYQSFVDQIIYSLPFLPLFSDGQMLLRIWGTLLIIGTFLGTMGSIISVRRFLKV